MLLLSHWPQAPEASAQSCPQPQLTAPTNYTAGMDPHEIVIADFNGDGRPDLATLLGGGVAILLGLDNGGFGPPTNFAPGVGSLALGSGDFNSDGKTDLVTGNQYANNITILLGTGTGAFGAPSAVTGVANPSSLAVADLNGDGRSDIVVGNFNADDVSIFLGDGAGHFGSALRFAAGSGPSGLAVGDFNSDGKPDLAVSNWKSLNVSILLGAGTGSFGPATHFPVPGNIFGGPGALAVADFDHDSDADLAVQIANVPGASVAILLGDGAGSFGPHTLYGGSGGSSSPNALTLADFNRDGILDIASAKASLETVSVVLGNGDGSFGPPKNLAAGSHPHSVGAGDFNNDGKPDLAVMNFDSDNVSILLNVCVCWEGVADGTFEAGSPWPSWTTQWSSQFGTPLCDTGCGTGGGTAGPFSGTNWAWFGGTSVAPEVATLGQSTLFPALPGLRLQYQKRIGAVTAPFTDSLVVSVDGVTVVAYAEPPSAEPGYSQEDLDVSAFADGAVHQLLFSYAMPDAGGSNFTVDDVKLVACEVLGLSVADVVVTEGDAGTTSAAFTVSLSSATDRTVTVAYATAAGTALAGTDYLTASGTLTFPPGTTRRTVSVPIAGDVSDEADETLFLNLTSPVNATITRSTAQGTILDNDAAPALTIDDVTRAETQSGTTAFTFTVTLSAPSAFTASVGYGTTPVTATAGVDYLATSGTLTFAPGQTTKTVSVTVNGDTQYEADEIFNVTLSGPSQATIADGTGAGTIANDDAAPSLAIDDVTRAETNSGTTAFSFTVTLSPASVLSASVDYSTMPVTATAGADYVTTSGTLTFAAGETSKTLTVQVVGETRFEGDETFQVVLSGASRATIGDGTGLGTISNDDVPPARVFVSVAGADTNDCSNAATPCRTFGAAIEQVATDGEVIVSKSGSYAGATIGKALKIGAAPGVVAFSAQPITVNAGGGASVVIRGLTFKAATPGTGNALLIQSAASVFVENSVMDGWDVGIRLQGAAELFVKDSTLRNNNTGLSATTGKTAVDNSRFLNNGIGLAAEVGEASLRAATLSGNTTAGIRADGGSSVTVEKSQLSNNETGVTLPMSSGATVRLSRCVVSGNGLGLENLGGTLEVSGNNVIRGNTTDTAGTITTTGLQ